MTTHRLNPNPNPNPQPITARIDAPQTYNYALKHQQKLSTIGSNKKMGWNQCMNSISPWGVDDFSSRNSVVKSEGKKKRAKIRCGVDWKVAGKNKGNCEENITIINFDPENVRLSNKKRTKTETQANHSSTKIKLNTIQVSNNLHMIPSQSQKYYSQDCPDRKMSMQKLRQTFLKTSRSKGPTSNTNFLQTRSDIQKKIQQKMLPMFPPQSSTSTSDPSAINRRLKTIQNQNECPLMFFFEAKNSRNMMEREKNIMKIRNLSKKGHRAKTDVVGV